MMEVPLFTDTSDQENDLLPAQPAEVQGLLLPPSAIVVTLNVVVDGPSAMNRWMLTSREADTGELTGSLLQWLAFDRFPSEWWRELVEGVVTAQSRVSPF